MRKTVQTLFILLTLTVLLLSCQSNETTNQDWTTYGGDKSSTRYSALTQINRGNVKNLEVAWVYRTGDADTITNRTQIQCQPIIVNGILYASSPMKKFFALDAATGKELWVFDPLKEITEGENAWAGTNRGVTYWESGGDSRILLTVASYLFALDAQTGEVVRSFGKNGKIDLHDDLDYDKKDFFIVSNTPGIIYKDLLILGMRLSEGADAAPGHIRAYNVKTGKRAWIFHTIPHPKEMGYDTWEDATAWQKIGGANNWAGMALDEARGIVFVPTGSAAFDFYGGNRKGENLFANCLIAINAATGERIWHFQTTHHDIWDRDLPANPNLVTLTIEGKKIDAVAQITKQGLVFLFERETGKPIFPIEEIPAPASELAGEQSHPTQPVPTKPEPFARQVFTEEEITNISPEAHNYVKEIWQKTKTGQRFIPPSKQGTIILPGFDGGAEWGGASFDEETGILYVNANEMPWILTIIDIDQKGDIPQTLAEVGKSVYSKNCLACHGANREGNTSGSYPSLLGLNKKYKQAEILQLLNNGKGMMPAFKHIADDEKNALIAFLLEIVQKQEVGTKVMAKQTVKKVEIPYTTTGYNRFLDQNGYPAIRPPWGTLNAIDLNSGKILWKVPLGEFEELTKQGIAVTGTENYGGAVVTKGGLLFIGASKDEKFRAFDKANGMILWETKLPAGAYATPATYQIKGKQYIVVAAGGGKMGTRSGDSYVAYALRQ
ncbi:MAG: pyrroloquinoline quinone-dependent dehydrogenase [Cytophagales bacterium]|nr:MAG: pyrroloquinoline quinone-dependent dehydrogenase [Cytophagales bacterium]